MRLTLAAFLALFFSITLAAGSELSISRVWPEYRTAESFTRISEYFSGRENTSGEGVLRTQPAVRNGYYFLTRIKNSGHALPEARVELQVIAPTSPQAKIYTFNTPIRSGSHVINLGLTGIDWNDAHAKAVAWQMRVLAPDGTELTRTQSYLWSQPDAPLASAK